MSSMFSAGVMLTSAFLSSITNQPPQDSLPRICPPSTYIRSVKEPRLELAGRWKFSTGQNENAILSGAENFIDALDEITVPGHWTMQGFDIPTDEPAVCVRSFEPAADWKGKRIRLRCNGIYSDATVFINGKQIGSHLGGFTAFEFDVTDAVKIGRKNQIAIRITSNSIADTLASGNQYAAFSMGGIIRDIFLFAVPEMNIADYHIETTFDENFQDGILTAAFSIANQGGRAVDKASVQFTLRSWPDGKEIEIDKPQVRLEEIAAGANANFRASMRIEKPRKWDPEHPNLYTLECSLIENGRKLQTVSRRFGFRQVEVRGSRLFVNNMPIKLRGVNRHETDPQHGRSIDPTLWHKDVEMFKNANCNYIRTSHYPPDEKFLDACDELGMFVELEAPICWIGHGANSHWKTHNPADSTLLPLMKQLVRETICRDRSRSCVIIWSLANESTWNDNFVKVLELARSLDRTRPTSFHDQCWGGFNNHGSRCDIANFHYPGPAGPANTSKFKRPVLFGEYCHLNTYNRQEIITDPGVRDDWGRGFAKMWEEMWHTDQCLGGALWSGIDDIFYLPNGRAVGYGSWGVIDCWRRTKPETFHVYKAYSPIQLRNSTIIREGDTFSAKLEIENRHDFTSLSRLRISYSIADKNGFIDAPDIAPHSTGTIETGTLPFAEGSSLKVIFTAPDGRIVNSFDIPAATADNRQIDTAKACDIEPKVSWTDESLSIESGKAKYSFDVKSGGLLSADISGRKYFNGPAELMILGLKTQGCLTEHSNEIKPLNDVCSGWKLDDMTAEVSGSKVTVRVSGNYDQARGSISYSIEAGDLTVDYDFSIESDIDPRQWGLAFSLAPDFRRLSWARDAQWSSYPLDHIGRASGTAPAFYPDAPQVQFGSKPQPLWSRDCNRLGSADFRSTRYNIFEYRLSCEDGRTVTITADGTQSARSWIEDESVRMLAAGFSTGGADSFFSSHLASERRPLKKSDRIKATVVLQLSK